MTDKTCSECGGTGYIANPVAHVFPRLEWACPECSDDGDERVEPELDRQTDYNAPPRDDGDDYEDDYTEEEENEILDMMEEEEFNNAEA